MSLRKLIALLSRKNPVCLIALFFLLVFLPAHAQADGIGGFLEYNYGKSWITQTDANGTTTSNSTFFSQRYSLMMDKNLTTTLTLMGGANVQISRSVGDAGGVDSNSTTTRVSPYLGLNYANGMFSGGAAFRRNMLSAKSNGISTPSTFNDSSTAFLAWKPEGLPTFNLLFSNQDNYDEFKASQNINAKSVTFSSQYRPHKSLDLNYTGNISTSKDHLQGFDTESLTQSLRTVYSDNFLDNRVSLNTSYNIALQNSTITNNGTASGSGQLTAQVFPLPNAGFFLVTVPPVTPELSTLDPRQDLVNGNANIPLGISPLVVNPYPLNARLNFGMQFNGAVDPTLRISKIRVLVASNLQDLSAKTLLLQNTFVWSVYVSNDNANWTQVSPVSSTFTLTNPASGNPEPGFEINFAAIAGVRFIKVVTAPAVLNDSTGLPLLTSITVSSLAAYFTSVPTPVGTSRASSQISGAYDMNLKARLWNLPLVTYDLGFNLAHNKSDSTAFTYRYNVTNGLSLFHQLSPIVSTSARLARQDGVDPDNVSSSTAFSTSLSVTPLPTLTHAFNFSARQDKDRSLTRTVYSLSNANSAELYRGVSASLSLTGSLTNESSGKEQKDVLVATGINLVPHRSLSININAAATKSSVSGGPRAETSNDSRTAGISVSYTPLPSIYLFVSSTIVAQTGQVTQTATNFGGSWAPFRDGTLQFSTAYNETLQGVNKTSTFSQSMHWKINPSAFLDISYLLDINSGSGQETTNEGVNAVVRVSF